MEPKVQISLDLTSIPEALETAHMAVRAGVDWLEAGTPLVLAEGLHSVRALRDEFPTHPIVADLKIMDGGYLEAELAARAGATHVVVMARAHPATLRVENASPGAGNHGRRGFGAGPADVHRPVGDVGRFSGPVFFPALAGVYASECGAGDFFNSPADGHFSFKVEDTDGNELSGCGLHADLGGTLCLSGPNLPAPGDAFSTNELKNRRWARR